MEGICYEKVDKILTNIKDVHNNDLLSVQCKTETNQEIRTEQSCSVTEDEIQIKIQVANSDDSASPQCETVRDEDLTSDDSSDSEDYEPSESESASADDVDTSSGEEEIGVKMEKISLGSQTFFKLKFDDVEQKRQEYLKRLGGLEIDISDSSDSANSTDRENDKDAKPHSQSSTVCPSVVEVSRRQVFLEDLEDSSDEDEHFDPIYCGETLSDLEYAEIEECDTESEVEFEEQGENAFDKRTGEALLCIRMTEDLQIPPDDTPQSSENVSMVEPGSS